MPLLGHLPYDVLGQQRLGGDVEGDHLLLVLDVGVEERASQAPARVEGGDVQRPVQPMDGLPYLFYAGLGAQVRGMGNTHAGARSCGSSWIRPLEPTPTMS